MLFHVINDEKVKPSGQSGMNCYLSPVAGLRAGWLFPRQCAPSPQAHSDGSDGMDGV